MQRPNRILSSTLGAALLVAALSACTSGVTANTSVKDKFPQPIDLANARADCLKKSGWDVTVHDDASISVGLKKGDETRYDADDMTCLKGLGIDPAAPTSEADIKSAYKLSIKGAACLERAGWSISSPPSFDTYKQNYESEAWFPWDQVPEKDAEAATAKCPLPAATY